MKLRYMWALLPVVTIWGISFLWDWYYEVTAVPAPYYSWDVPHHFALSATCVLAFSTSLFIAVEGMCKK